MRGHGDRHRLGAQRRWGRINVPMLAAALATLISTCAYAGHRKAWWSVPGLEKLEQTTIDTRFRLRGERLPENDDIIIVGVDDKVREEFPEVFQTRRGWAKLITAMSAQKPLAIGLDMFFQSPEVSLDPEVVAEVREAHEVFGAETGDKTEGGVKALAALDAVIDQTRGDEMLAASIKRAKRVYLGVLFFFPEPGEKPAPPGAKEPPGLKAARYGEAVNLEAPRSRRPPQAAGVATALRAIAEGTVGAGALNVIQDSDGTVRKINAVIQYGDRFYMPLGLSMALARLEKGTDAAFVVGEESIRVGDARAPVTGRGEAHLSYLGPNKTFPRVSAADILAGRAPGALEGKLVFVGFTDVARDKIITPFDTHLDGVEIHATLAHNILHGELMREVSPITTLLTIFLMGAALTALQLRRIRQRRSWVIGVGALVAIAGYLIAAHVAFSGSGLIVEVAAPIEAALFTALASLSAALATEGREKRAYREAFSQYVNDTLADRIASDPSLATLTLGGVRRDLTVLFSDIRGFSGFSERLEPEALSDFLNEYLTPMTDLVHAEDGMLDKYIGDAVMAVYGAPVELTDHAVRACRTALHMQAALGPLNARWRERKLPEITIGIGVNSGPMSVGNMGSESKFDYTVMGDAVNLGARLEALTKEYLVDILVGEKTAYAASGEFVFRELDLVRVKGRDGSARVYELLGRLGSVDYTDEDLAVFQDGLEAYRAREWTKAEESFDVFLENHADDGPSTVMRDRVRHLRDHPPADDWDGVYAQLGK